MQFEARAAAEAEKEQLFLKKSEKVPNELLVLVGGFAFSDGFSRSGTAMPDTALLPNGVL